MYPSVTYLLQRCKISHDLPKKLAETVDAMYKSESMKVLLAEDEKKVSHFIRKALREAGYEVETAYDENQAMDQAAKQPFMFIILILLMPGKHGPPLLLRLLTTKNP